jgi:hypothetical protein
VPLFVPATPPAAPAVPAPLIGPTEPPPMMPGTASTAHPVGSITVMNAAHSVVSAFLPRAFMWRSFVGSLFN